MKNKREAIHALVDKVLDVQENTKHYADIHISGVGHDVCVYVMEGGFELGKDYSFQADFDFSEPVNGTKLRRMLAYLDGLARGGKPEPENDAEEMQE